MRSFARLVTVSLWPFVRLPTFTPEICWLRAPPLFRFSPVNPLPFLVLLFFFSTTSRDPPVCLFQHPSSTAIHFYPHVLKVVLIVTPLVSLFFLSFSTLLSPFPLPRQLADEGRCCGVLRCHRLTDFVPMPTAPFAWHWINRDAVLKLSPFLSPSLCSCRGVPPPPVVLFFFPLLRALFEDHVLAPCRRCGGVCFFYLYF